MPQVFAEEIKSIPMSPNLGESLERAGRIAREQGHRVVVLEHLLLALTEDPEASIILQSANVDLGQLGTDVSGHLGTLSDAMRSADGSEPRPDNELLRVLQAAASAAQQSKRRQIDGAIVLAAVVGDGKSPAAGILKSHGMTFEEAIRAIQRANTKARLKPIPKPAAAAAPAPQPQPEPPPPARPREPQPPPEAAATLRAAVPETHAALVEEPAGEPKPSSPRPPMQSADDILAAARARIQRRAAALNQPATVTPFPGPAPGPVPSPANGAHAPAPPAEETRREDDDQVSGAMRDLLAASVAPQGAPAGIAAMPAEPDLPEQDAFNGATHPDPDPAHRFPSPPPHEMVPPPPLAARAAPSAPIQVPQHAPAPPLAPPMAPPRAARSNGAAADRLQPLPPWPDPTTLPARPRPPVAAPAPPAAPPPPAEPHRLTRASAPLPAYPAAPPPRKGAGQAADRSPLQELFPRTMKIDVTSAAEVRIPRNRLDSLLQMLIARSSLSPHDPIVARALTVRLRTSESVYIELATPETQWLEQGAHVAHDEALVWRWNLTPKDTGKTRLTLLVSMRSASLDGTGEEVALPDRYVDMKVRGRRIRKFLRFVGFMGLLGLTFFLGRIGGELGPMLVRSLRSVVGL